MSPLVSVLAVIASLMATQFAEAVAPSLGVILPRGGQRGTDIEVRLHGGNLGDAVDLMFHSEGISLAEIAPQEDGTVKAKLTVAPDCRVGVHAIRVRTKTGLSNLQLFSVGNLAEIAETEPNNDALAPQEIALGSVINGVIESEDVDYFAVNLEQGGRVAVESEAIRLGTALFDIKLRLFDPKGIELLAEDDTALFRQDAGFVYTAKDAGRHVIAVSEASYGGAGNYWYRLHVGDFPRPFGVSPMGGVAGAETPVTWLGDSALTTQTVVAPASDTGESFVVPASDTGVAPTALPFRVSAYPGVVEVEPTDNIEQATAGSVPGAFDGVIGKDADADWFAFEGKTGQVFDVRLWARALGSPLDSVMFLHQPTENKALVSDDDARGVDSYFRVTLPEDGLYKLWVGDHLRRGGPTFAYRVEVTPVTPSMTFRVEYNEPASISVPRGNRNMVLMIAQRAEFGDEVALAMENLPPGLVAGVAPFKAGESVFPVVLEAAADAPVGGSLVDVVGTFGEVKGHFNQQVVLVYGNNKTIFADNWVTKLATAVTEEAPFSIQIAETKTPVVQNARKFLKMVATRKEGFVEPINVRVPWLPAKFGAGTAQIPGDQSEVELLLEAQWDAPVGTVDVVVVGESAGWQVCTPKTPIAVSEQWVNFQVANVEVEQGKPVEAVVTVTQKLPYEGTFQAEMSGLPKGVETTTLPFTKDTTELRFPLTVAADSPPGKHASMYIGAIIDSNGEPVRHVSGGAELRIFEPLPAALQQAAAPEPVPEAQAEPAPERKTRFGSTQ